MASQQFDRHGNEIERAPEVGSMTAAEWRDAETHDAEQKARAAEPKPGNTTPAPAASAARAQPAATAPPSAPLPPARARSVGLSDLARRHIEEAVNKICANPFRGRARR